MKLTLDKADIVSAKIEEIVVDYPSIEAEIKATLRNGTISLKEIRIDEFPHLFEAFFWKLKGKTLIAIRQENLTFKLYVLRGLFPEYYYKIQGMREYRKPRFGLPTLTKTEKVITVFKHKNDSQSKITIVV